MTVEITQQRLTPEEILDNVPDDLRGKRVWTIDELVAADEHIRGLDLLPRLLDYSGGGGNAMLDAAFTWAAPVEVDEDGGERVNYRVIPADEVKKKWARVPKKLRKKAAWNLKDCIKAGFEGGFPPDGFMNVPEDDDASGAVNLKIIPIDERIFNEVEQEATENSGLKGIRKKIAGAATKVLEFFCGKHEDKWTKWSEIPHEQRKTRFWTGFDWETSGLTEADPVSWEHEPIPGFDWRFNEAMDPVRVEPIGYRTINLMIDQLDTRPELNEQLHRNKLPIAIFMTVGVGGVATVGGLALALSIGGGIWHMSADYDGPVLVPIPEDTPVAPEPEEVDDADAHEGEDDASDDGGEPEEDPVTPTPEDDDAGTDEEEVVPPSTEEDADAADTPEEELSPTPRAANSATWYTLPSDLSVDDLPAVKKNLQGQDACAALIVTCEGQQFKGATGRYIKGTCEKPDIQKSDWYVVVEGSGRYSDITPRNYDASIPHPKYTCMATVNDGNIVIYFTESQFTGAK